MPLDALFNAQTTEAGLFLVLANHPRLARWAAYALARTGRTAAAIEALERARARELDVSTRRATADLEAVRRCDPDVVDRYSDSLTAYNAKAGQPQLQLYTVPADAATRGDQAVAAAATLNRVIDEIRAIPGFERFLTPPTAAESLLAAGVSQAIYIASAPCGTFVLRVAAERPHAAPRYDALHVDVTSHHVVQMLLFDTDTGDPGLLSAQLPKAGPHALEHALAQLRASPRLWRLAELAAETPTVPSVLVPTGLVGLIPLLSLRRLLPRKQRLMTLLRCTSRLRWPSTPPAVTAPQGRSRACSSELPTATRIAPFPAAWGNSA